MFSTVDMPCHLKNELRFWWRVSESEHLEVQPGVPCEVLEGGLCWNLTENYKTRCGWLPARDTNGEGRATGGCWGCACVCMWVCTTTLILFISVSLGSARCSFQHLLCVSCGGNGAQAVNRKYTAAQIIALRVCACLGVLVYKHIMCVHVCICVCIMYVWSITKYICKKSIIVESLTALLFYCLFPSLTSASKLYFLYYR